MLATPPTLEVFYSPTCAPCRLELPAVAAFSREDGARVQVIILDQENRARAELRTASPTLEAQATVNTDPSPGAALRAAGDSDGILPYARSMAGGRVCATWQGRLTVNKARELVKACIDAVTPRSPPRS